MEPKAPHSSVNTSPPGSNQFLIDVSSRLRQDLLQKSAYKDLLQHAHQEVDELSAELSALKARNAELMRDLRDMTKYKEKDFHATEVRSARY